MPQFSALRSLLPGRRDYPAPAPDSYLAAGQCKNPKFCVLQYILKNNQLNLLCYNFSAVAAGLIDDFFNAQHLQIVHLWIGLKKNIYI
jgi:hypothetical protein